MPTDKPVWAEVDSGQLAAVKTEVTQLDKRMSGLETGLGVLSEKVDAGHASLVRTISENNRDVVTQIAENARAQNEGGAAKRLNFWTAVGGVSATMALVVGFLAWLVAQLLSPIDARVNKIEGSYVPRSEHQEKEKRIERLEDQAKIDEARRYNELNGELDRLRHENLNLKRQ